MAFKDTAGGKAFIKNLWNDNPVFRQVLGICSTLAVTNLLKNTLLMCGGLIFATALSSWTLSLMRAYVPKQVRMMVQVLIIAAYVIIVDIFIRAQYPDIHKTIGPYIGLIITNCIIMGRAEAFASKNPDHHQLHHHGPRRSLRLEKSGLAVAARRRRRGTRLQPDPLLHRYSP